VVGRMPSARRGQSHHAASITSRPSQRPASVSLSSSAIPLDSPHASDDWVSAWRDQQLRQTQQDSYFPEIGVPGPSRPRPNPTPRPRPSSHAGGFTPIHHPKSPAQYRLFASDTLDDSQRRLSFAQSDPRRSSSSSYTHLSLNGGVPPSVSTPPSSDAPPDEPGSPSSDKRERQRRRSLSPSMVHRFDTLRVGSPPKHAPGSPKIVLRPQVNTTVSHLSTLSQSNHTLSPYTHSLEHFTVRSVPPRMPRTPEERLSSAAEKQKPVKARRKRLIDLAGKAKAAAAPPQVSSLPSPGAPSEFSDDVDHYFRAGDDPSSVRRRHPYVPT